jgi:hypothetical protein
MKVTNKGETVGKGKDTHVVIDRHKDCGGKGCQGCGNGSTVKLTHKPGSTVTP